MTQCRRARSDTIALYDEIHTQATVPLVVYDRISTRVRRKLTDTAVVQCQIYRNKYPVTPKCIDLVKKKVLNAWRILKSHNSLLVHMMTISIDQDVDRIFKNSTEIVIFTSVRCDHVTVIKKNNKSRMSSYRRSS